jgi:hypothetical protein
MAEFRPETVGQPPLERDADTPAFPLRKIILKTTGTDTTPCLERPSRKLLERPFYTTFARKKNLPKAVACVLQYPVDRLSARHN